MTMDVITENPLTMEQLSAVADVGGVATGTAGDSYFSATLGADATSADVAGSSVSDRVLAIMPGTVVALQALLTKDFDAKSLVMPNRVGEAGLVKVLLMDAKDGGTYHAESYTVFANGRLEILLSGGETVEFDLWMDAKFLPQ